jgi:predicted nucleic acid-binding Zn ribbon protein
VSRWRNGSVTDRCAVCDDPMPLGRPRMTCSDACRQALWRRRHQPPPPSAPQLPASRPRKPGTVYECPACDIRLLGVQRCECGSFMRRLGPGGLCPCCDEAITFEELATS